ncbi:MAG TPA: tetratricopeptide repeat protein [Phenylobacterium sp.]|uniref:O-linked N-acetylglucosamine transferase family protein n=1 Tax=Phenylobacterium sp. TaxID=1871053 RepID=UPI002CEFB300|nr:tetratricopeptide repeat protein [Phenylobacterium sp.]HSV01641.1 tetratricopeptide repeat protein [Phenylobacterium sp.]
MNQRLVGADAALKAGQREAAIAEIIAAIAEDPGQPAQAYRVLIHQLYLTNRLQEGADWSSRAVARHPKDIELWNLRGVLLRRLGRFQEALEALDQATRLDPRPLAPVVNRGNIYLDMGDMPKAEAVFTRLVRQEPRNAEHQRQLGRALQRQGKREAAIVRFRQALALRKDYVDAWLDLAGALHDLHRDKQAQETLDKAVAVLPHESRLHEAKSVLFRRRGELRRAEAYLQEIRPRFEAAAWLHYQLGGVVSEYDRERGNLHLRRAVELDPDRLEHRMALVESLERTRSGDEGANIEEAYQMLKATMARETLTTPAPVKIANEVLIRVCDFEALDSLGTFHDVGRLWAESGRHTALLKQLARVRSAEDRLELVEQHRIWGRQIEAVAPEQPLRRPPRRAKDGKIRLGFMSSDLRQHPVAYFSLPLFDHIDRERFDVYCYSYFQGQEDRVQRYIAEQVAAFRWNPDIAPRDAAQVIADDQLDMLIELGGSTHMNKLEVMAWRAAPLQASWLGYPHSAGLSTIDYFICDPFSVPPNRELMIEQPLMMPHSWLALGRVFSAHHPLTDGLPEDRNGFITFGTANNPHKYSPEVLRLWARIVARTPDSRFAFIRPEGGSASFRKNVLAAFAAEGVGQERVVFHPVRGQHMPYYNEVDITLDPFPLTGGTTTTESLWMGVPLVSLVGEAFFERLSYSILSNIGLGDLCAADLEQYVEIAMRLVAERERRRDLRSSLRERMRDSPLGRDAEFARDFYDMVAAAVAEARARDVKVRA